MEEKADYITDANEMIGKGYDQPTVILEEPRKYSARLKNGITVEVEEPAWVKFSTGFKKELKSMDEYSLKVFLYIGLSVNWQSGTSYPGTRKIAEDTNMAVNTVTKAIKYLEENGYLEVQRRNGNSSIFRTVKYIAIGTVAHGETPPSHENAQPSHEVWLTVARTPSKSAQLEELEEKETPKGDLVDAVLQYELKPTSIRSAIKEYFRLNVNWETKTARQWMEWAVSENVTSDQIARAADLWRMDKRFNWAPPTLKGIFEKWQMLNTVEVTHKTTVQLDSTGKPETY